MRLSLLVLLSTSAPLVPQHFFGAGGHVLVTAHATPEATRSTVAISMSRRAMRLMLLSPFRSRSLPVSSLYRHGLLLNSAIAFYTHCASPPLESSGVSS